MSSWSRSLVVIVLAFVALNAASAATIEELLDLRTSLEEHFTVLPLTDGILLQPVAGGSGPRTVEISGARIALDGVPVGRDEVRVRLGVAAEAVLATAALDSGEQSELLAVSPADIVPAVEATVERDEDASKGEELEELEEAEAEVEADPSAISRRERAERPGPPPPPPPRAPRRRRSHSGDTAVAVARSMTIAEDEVAEEVVVFGGFLKVEGRVEGDATVIGGSATIEGEVTGDVTAIGGPVRLENGTYVGGSVVSVGGEVYQDDGARVDGEVERVRVDADISWAPWAGWRAWDRHRSHDFDFSPWGWWSGLGWKLIWIFFLAGLAWLALLIFKGPIERMERRIEREPWKTGLVGLLAVALFLPTLVLLCVFLAISIIGIPLLIVVPFGLLALVVIAWLGFVATAGRVGSWFEDKFGWSLGSPFWVVLLGLGVIVALSFVGDLLNFGLAPLRFMAGMFLFFGGVVWFAAWVFGIGAAVLTRFGTSESWSRAEELAAPLPPVPGSGAADDEAVASTADDSSGEWVDERFENEPEEGERDDGDPDDRKSE